MTEFPKYYTLLFATITDVLGHLEDQNYGLAKEDLIQGQKMAEELYLADMDGKPLITSEKLKFVVDSFYDFYLSIEKSIEKRGGA